MVTEFVMTLKKLLPSSLLENVFTLNSVKIKVQLSKCTPSSAKTNFRFRVKSIIREFTPKKHVATTKYKQNGKRTPFLCHAIKHLIKENVSCNYCRKTKTQVAP